ncbi:BglG family transcription antiterminator [Fodinisporobacter ferrooxydans]|uniref:Ascorbate-specific PTS system EIIA component n=1 Tax=Fodinisporobacter ferrooxydans TaxID=2901836 RepID=A0ABY4CIR2_9BACL|nr:BglG family transcription antiterminator [Alicyclobacillaceae bacterium MYW30-H2]
MLDDRSSSLLREILMSPGLKSCVLEKKVKLTRRQINYSIDKINDWLVRNNLPTIKKNRQGIFLVDSVLYERFPELSPDSSVYEYYPTEKERSDLLLLYLLSRTEELSLLHLTSALRVSKNTVLNDLKFAQQTILSYQLEINYTRQNGYYIGGEEFNKRCLIIEVVNRIVKMPYGKKWILKIGNITDEEIEDVSRRFDKLETYLQVQFTDEKMLSMPYIMVLILRRIKKNKKLVHLNIYDHELQNTIEFQAVKNFFSDTTDLDEYDELFLTVLILSTNVSNTKNLDEKVMESVIRSLENLLLSFERLACVQLQKKDDLLMELYQHFKPAFYRIKFGLIMDNPLQEIIQNDYRELHHLVKKAAQSIIHLIGCEIPESECAYLTMLLGGWLRKQGQEIKNRIRVVVVCQNGVSVSKLLFETLREIFPEFLFLDSLSIREFNQYTFDYDLIFSTQVIHSDKELFIVSPLLNDEEKHGLRVRVMQELYGYTPINFDTDSLITVIKEYATILNEDELKKSLQDYFKKEHIHYAPKEKRAVKPSLDELITEETIVLEKYVVSWEKAIRTAAEPLLRNNSIHPGYVDAMIQMYQPSDPYIVIAPRCAIPHADPEAGVSKLSMSLLRLEQGVEFSKDKQVNIVVVIAATDKKSHFKALMQLTNLFGAEQDVTTIIESKQKKEIVKIIKKYSEGVVI